jgi:type I restriction enzyme S subunit
MSREMRHSGIEWIGEIPKEWKVTKFKFMSEMYTGNSLNEHQKEYYSQYHNDESTLPYISTKDVERDIERVNYDGEIRIPESEKGFSIAPPNSVLLCIEGGSAGKKVGFTNQKICFVNKLCCFNSKQNSRYLFFYILSNAFNEPFTQNIQGLIGGVSVNTLKNFYITTPSLSEQQKIANYLDKVCGEVDEMIALQEQMIEELKAYKQSVITEAVTKGLNPNVLMKDSGIDWIKELPENWEVVTPKALFSLRKEKAIEGERQLTASQQYGVIYQDEYMQLTGTKVVTVMKDFDILKHVEAGDFVISMRSFQGGLEYSENTGSISSAYVMLIPNLEYVHPKFYRWLFKSVCYINALQSTSNMVRDGQAMRYSNFAQVPLYIVPLKEQQSIASYLDTKCAEIDAIIALKQSKIEELKEYKKSVIYEYVTGKKEVC